MHRLSEVPLCRLLGKCAYHLENTAKVLSAFLPLSVSNLLCSKAEQYYRKATTLKPIELPGWQGLAEIYENATTETEKAVAPLKQIVSIPLA